MATTAGSASPASRPPRLRVLSSLLLEHRSLAVEPSLLEVLVALLLIAGGARTRHFLPPLAAAWFVASFSGLACTALWRRRQPESCRRWQRAINFAFRCIMSVGCGLGAIVLQRVLRGEAAHGAAGGVGAFGALARLAFMSFGPSMALFACAWQLPIAWSGALQLSTVATLLPLNSGLCQALAAAHPATDGAVSALHRLLSLLAMPVPWPLVPLSRPRDDPAAECGTVLAWLQLGCGVLASLLWQAASEARLFARHQEQRRRAGQPEEAGKGAALYEWVWDASGQGSRGRYAVAAWLLLAVTWQGCEAWFA